MARNLTKSNAQFRRAIKRLPLGVASNFRYWGEDRTIYVKNGQGARIIDLDDNCYVDYRMGYGPAILGYAHPEVDQAAREGMQVGRRVCAVHRARIHRGGTHFQNGARRRAGALLQFGHGSGDGGTAPGARLHGQGRLRDARGRLSRAVRCGHVVHAHGQVVAGRRPGSQAVQRGRAAQHAQLRAFRAGQRCESAGRRVQAPRASHRLPADRTHHGQLPGDRGRAGISARGAQRCATSMAWCCSSTRSRPASGWRAAACRNSMASSPICAPSPRRVANGYPISVLAGREDIMRKIGSGVAHGGTYTAHSISLAAAEKSLQILDETDALERIADYGTRLRAGMRAVLGARGIAHSFVGHPSMSGLYFCARAAAQLPRLEGQRLFLLRRHGAGAARRGCAVRTGFARALVRVARRTMRPASPTRCGPSKSRSTRPCRSSGATHKVTA